MKQKGFTLIELLVVISIISLLTSIILITLSSARAKARNAKRVGDIKQLITAFNLGLNTSGLPTSGGNWVCVSTSCYNGWSSYTANATVDAYLQPYMSTKPADPTENGRGYGGYVYNSNWAGGNSPFNGTSFPAGPSLNFVLELPNSSNVCGPARIYDVTATYVQCIYQFN